MWGAGGDLPLTLLRVWRRRGDEVDVWRCGRGEGARGEGVEVCLSLSTRTQTSCFHKIAHLFSHVSCSHCGSVRILFISLFVEVVKRWGGRREREGEE